MRPRVIDKLLGLVLPTDGYKSWLDIGTGDGNTCCSHPYYDKIEHKVGIDPQETVRKLHSPDFKVLRESYDEKSSVWNEKFDLVTMFDLLEHYKKPDALKLLKHLDEITNKMLIIFTPKGFYYQGGNEWDSHKSGWEPEELLELGFSVHLLKDFHEEGDALFAWKNNFIK